MQFNTKRLPWVVRDILLPVINRIRDKRIARAASSLAYTTILSIIPFLAVSLALFKSFGGMDRLYEMIEPLIVQNLAAGTGDSVASLIREYINNIRVGTLGATGMIALIFTSISLLSSAEKVINEIWEVKNEKSLLQRLAFYWMIITLGPIGLSVTLSAAGATQNAMPLLIAKKIELGTFLPLLVFIAFYKWVPATKVRWRAAIFPAVFSSVCFLLARALYGIYTSRVVSYNKIYGSLGAVPIILLWIYILWMIVLIGVALSTAIQEHKR